MDENLNNKIDKVMQALDGIEKASPNPFFFTRLEARMRKEKSKWETLSSFVGQPFVAFACICLIIIINATVIFSTTSVQTTADQSNNESVTADEYNSVSTPLYEFVNSNP